MHVGYCIIPYGGTMYLLLAFYLTDYPLEGHLTMR